MNNVQESKGNDVELVEVVRSAAATSVRPGYVARTPEERRLDRRVNLKLDLLVIVVLAAGFMFQGIDKSNIGNAATQKEFIHDANIRPTDVSNSVSLFSATYIPIMPISVALGRIIGPKIWIPTMLLAWGGVTTAQCAIHHRGILYGLRLLLGACEAGYVPICYYFIGTLFPAYAAGLRMGFISVSFTFAGAFSALIAYGIFHLKSSSWASWQLLFIIEGSITLFVGAVAFLVLPSKLSTAWFLTQEERDHAVRRMELDTASVDGLVNANSEDMDHTIRLKSIIAAFKDWRKMLIIIWTACATVPAYGFAIFTPLIVKGMGYSSVSANLMSVPPFLFGGVALITWVYMSDRFKERSLIAAAALFISIIGYSVLISSNNNKLRYGFLFVVMIGAGSINPLSAAWLNDNTPDKATRNIIMGIYGWNNVGGVIAGQVYSAKYGPSYKKSAAITIGLVAVATVGFIVSRLLYMHENRRRSREIASWNEEQFEHEKQRLDRLGHEKRYFLFGY